MKTKWLIDKFILKDTRYQNLKQKIEKLGYECYLSEYIPFMEDEIRPYPATDNVVVYGTVGFVRKTKAYNGNYCTENELTYSNYISNLALDSKRFVNGDFILVPYNYLKYNTETIMDMFGSDFLFIRPNTGTKLFTGYPFNRWNYNDEFSALEQLHGVTRSDLIVVSTAKKIIKEFRFIIVDHKVITGSQYILNGKHVEDKKYPKEALEVAKIVAKCEWQPDPIFTCDVAEMSDGSFKIIELNSFSCAGWYACDVNKIIKAVSEYSEKEWRDLWNI